MKDEDERDQRQIIKEAFAGDDVIRDFLKEKREAVEVSKPKDLDLTLPGWGEWGGMGLKPRAKKRHQFLIKALEGPPRKDKNLPNVIINEKRNPHAAAHQVRDREQFSSLLLLLPGSPPREERSRALWSRAGCDLDHRSDLFLFSLALR